MDLGERPSGFMFLVREGTASSAAFDEVFAGNGRQTVIAAAWLPPDDTVFGTDKPSERETPVQRQ